MNFEFAVACVTYGVGLVAVFYWIGAGIIKDADLYDMFISAAIIALPIWCIIVGIHWMIKTW